MPGRIFPLFHHSYHSPTSSSSSLESIANLSGTKRRPTHDNHQPNGPLKTGPAQSVGVKHSDSSPVSLGMTIESPPLVSYGPPKDSTGALLSGLLNLDIRDSMVAVNSLKMVLVAEVVTRRPITAHCAQCNMRSETLQTWTIISSPKLLEHGVNSYPFSYHVPGNLPATNTNVLGKIRYALLATAALSEGEIKFRKEIVLARSILPGSERHSVRIFPPTNLSANIDLPSVVHPGGDFPLTIRLDGVTSPEKETRWRLKKVSWRIDEHSRVISPACPHHSSKLGGDGKGILHEDVRVVGTGELKTGWKANYEKSGGRIEMELVAGLPAHVEAACDVESDCGIKVNHNLVVELIVAEEHCPTNPSKLVTPTGAARVLRMQFQLHVTARSGLGISWDEEQPPIYENVPPAPPTYIDTTSPHPSPPPSPTLPPVYFEGVSPVQSPRLNQRTL